MWQVLLGGRRQAFIKASMLMVYLLCRKCCETFYFLG